MSVADALQLMIGFGSLLISLISLIVALIKLKNDKKNNRPNFGRLTVIF
ncbi:putative holin-like toxin [Marinilactibacillus piezotolerans]|nr:putative holin-like toxin [Marinilactibacillus piezotolerans]